MTSDVETASTPMAAQSAAPAALPRLRLIYWSVRRELWEHRAIFIAPLAVAAVALVGFLLGAHSLPRDVHAAIAGSKRAGGALQVPCDFVAFAVFFTGLIVAAFYSLAALHNERRDRSLLFWKSLPVSDLTTVLSKAAVPLLVTPVVIFAVTIVAQLIMLALSTLIVTAGGIDPTALWSRLPLVHVWATLGQGLPVITLWYAPLNGWNMLVSAWAKRAPFLWSVVPPLALALLERLALGTHVIGSWLQLRLNGPFVAAYLESQHTGGPPVVNPAGWDSPHLWIGIVLAVGFFAAAVRLRRSADPI